MSLDLALSGINAANTDLNTIANNLANVDTTGFKGSTAEFSSLFAQTQQGLSQTQVGNGVQTAEIAQQFSQGNINTTSDNLDLALNGNGFFIVSNNGALSYTRNGAFQVDQNGYLVTASGERVQGYQPLSNGGFNTGGLSDLQLTTAEVAPSATSTANMALKTDVPLIVVGRPNSVGADKESLVALEVAVCEVFCAAVASLSNTVTVSPTLCAVGFANRPWS